MFDDMQRASNPLQQVHDYVGKLWGIIDLQKEEILRLKLQVQSLTTHALAVTEIEKRTAPVPGQTLCHKKNLTAVC